MYWRGCELLSSCRFPFLSDCSKVETLRKQEYKRFVLSSLSRKGLEALTGEKPMAGRCRGGRSAFRSRDGRFSTENKQKRIGRDNSRSPEHKWIKTGHHPDRSRRDVSPENKPRTSGLDRGRSRGGGSTDPSCLSRSQGMSPTDANKTKDEREKQLGFLSPPRKCSDLNEKTGSDRRGGQKPSNQSRSPAPKWRRTGWDVERPRGRDTSYSPANKQRTGWGRGGSRYRGRGRTNSPYRCQKSPIRMSRRSPSLQRSPSRVPRMDQDRVKKDGLEGRYDKKTNYGDNTVMEENNISQELQISSQYHEDAKEKAVKNSPGIEHSMNPMASQWDNDVCIASSHATSTLSVNPTAPQSLSNQHNPILASKVGMSQTNQNSVAEKPNTDAVMQPISCTYTNVGTSQARGSDTVSELSAVNPVDPPPEVPKLGQSQLNQNHFVANGTAAGEKPNEVDDHSFEWALIGFAKPKLKPFWLNRHLKEADYRQILSKFVNNVTRSLGTYVPQTHENICKFVKEQNDCLGKFLQMYLGRFVSEDVIINMSTTAKVIKKEEAAVLAAPADEVLAEQPLNDHQAEPEGLNPQVLVNQTAAFDNPAAEEEKLDGDTEHNHQYELHDTEGDESVLDAFNFDSEDDLLEDEEDGGNASV